MRPRSGGRRVCGRLFMLPWKHSILASARFVAPFDSCHRPHPLPRLDLRRAEVRPVSPKGLRLREMRLCQISSNGQASTRTTLNSEPSSRGSEEEEGPAHLGDGPRHGCRVDLRAPRLGQTSPVGKLSGAVGCIWTNWTFAQVLTAARPRLPRLFPDPHSDPYYGVKRRYARDGE